MQSGEWTGTSMSRSRKTSQKGDVQVSDGGGPQQAGGKGRCGKSTEWSDNTEVGEEFEVPVG